MLKIISWFNCLVLGSMLLISSSSTAAIFSDTLNRWIFQVSAGGMIFTPGNINSIPESGYSFDFIRNDTRITSIMYNSQGVNLQTGLILDLKHNPISPCADIAFSTGKFNMIEYDEMGNEISRSWFRGIQLATVGAGVDIGSKYFNFGLKYRIGMCAGGMNNSTLPFVPIAVKDNKLNLISNVYQGLDISLGAQYKNFNLKLRRGVPLTQPIHLSSGVYVGLLSMSLEFGYNFRIMK